MAERKSGPVKPPVIDLKAREASGTPETETPAVDSADAARSKASGARGRAARTKAAAARDTDQDTPLFPQEADGKAGGQAAGTDGTAPSEAKPEAAADMTPEPQPEPEPEAEPEPQPAPVGQSEASPSAQPDNVPEVAASPEPEPAADPPSPPADEIDAAPEPEAPAQPSPAAAPPPPPRPPARLAMPWSAISLAAIGGAVLGAGLTYLVANWIALPQQPPPFADPTPALADLSVSTATIVERLDAIEAIARDTRVGLDATVAQFDATTGELRQSIADVEASIPEPQPVDLSPIEGELETLESRVAAIAAGASSDDAATLASNLSSLEATLGTLDSRLGALESRLADGDGQLASIAASLEEARAAIAAQTRNLGGANIGPAVRLPLIVSGLEAAFANGRAYGGELAGLTTMLPDLMVPPVVRDNAETGLARPDALESRFRAVLPDIITGRTRESTGDWAQDALEWTRALLALRPADEIEGDTPEAIISRLEAAVERRDFVAAATLLAQLPEPMRQAAGAVGADIAAHAQAEAFVTALRAQALEPAMEPATEPAS